tara:strand:+ start:114 stop:776 length:663 start_codon:yes stop_codon:yes gene_type:complete
MNFCWSYSSLSLFSQCARKFHRLRILKDIVEPESRHLTYGKEVHQVAEEYGRDNKEIPEEHKFIQPHIDTLLGIAGDKFFEHKMALTADLEPCDFWDKEAWWRGIADFISVDNKNAFLVDYKTGKSARYADNKQLEILSLAIFNHFPEVECVKGGLLFLVSEEFKQATFYREEEEKYWATWDTELARLNMSFEADTWNPTSNFTCRKFCPVLDCEYNGRG